MDRGEGWKMPEQTQKASHPLPPALTGSPAIHSHPHLFTDSLPAIAGGYGVKSGSQTNWSPGSNEEEEMGTGVC